MRAEPKKHNPILYIDGNEGKGRIQEPILYIY